MDLVFNIISVIFIIKCRLRFYLQIKVLSLEYFISRETGVPVFRAENPLTCVVLGTGKYLDELKYIKRGVK